MRVGVRGAGVGTVAETKTILVAGATGQQGGSVVRALVKHRHRVRGLTRYAEKMRELKDLGVEVAGPEARYDKVAHERRLATTATVPTRIPRELENGVERLMREEHLEKSAALRKLLHVGIENDRPGSAVRAYDPTPAGCRRAIPRA